MPALLTHYLCGDAMLKLTDDEYIKKVIYDNRNVFNLGTQGPDIFFYYGAWPWVNSEKINRFGDRMHEEKTGEFIIEALKYTSALEKPLKELLTVYLCGYLCHYSLDCHTHPYIFYKSGFVRKGEKYTSKYTCYHRMFETALDVLMLKHQLGLNPRKFNSSVQIAVDKAATAAIGNMYSVLVKKVYAVDICSELVSKAITDMAAIASALRDKTGIKKKLLETAEKALGKLPMLSSMILPKDLQDKRDYLNSSHYVWLLPWDNTAKTCSTFIEGFMAAALESKTFTEAILHLYQSTMDFDSIATLVGNRSFSTGEDCSLNLEFRYYDCIFE